MKKLVLIGLVMLIVSSIHSQSSTPVKYHKVSIEGDNNLAELLSKEGITIDHSEIKGNFIIAEISDYELAVLQQKNFKHTVLISDMASFYEERAKQEYANKSMAAGLCNAPNLKKPAYFHLGTMGGFFKLSEMEAILDSMVLLYPNLITTKQPISSTKSIEGRDIWYVKISDNPNVDESEPEVLYSAIHHAREAASLSQLIFYMWYMLENYSTNPDIKFLVDNTEMYFVPCLNPDGYVYNQTTNPNGGGMWRKNRKNNGANFGVDLNRNYGYQWGYDNSGSSPNSNSDSYRGTAAFSEPETQAMRNFCNNRQFKAALNAHTYSNLLIYPWGYIPSYLTPDSVTFTNWSVYMTETSRFLYGTGDQTVGYLVNGDSDDWMYGEQGSKPKILSMTPEAGSAGDGFWPAPSRILDICKTTFNQNIALAKVVTNFAWVKDNRDKFLSTNGYIHYNITRLGLENGSFTISVVPVGFGIANTGPAKTYPSLTLNQSLNDSISYSLAGSINQGQVVKYALAIDNGFYVHYDTLSKISGTPVTVLYDPCTNIGNWNAGGWGVASNSFVSTPGCITDSPFGNYAANQNKNITLLSNLNLSGATYAHLQYYTRFQLEKNYDFVQLYASNNNGSSWQPLCARYETSPASFGGTNPVYDGLQDEFVKEEIDLSDYLGQNILIRFNIKTDAYEEQDGFYFDDFLVRKIMATATLAGEVIASGELKIYPNPSSGSIKIENNGAEDYTIIIRNQLGQLVKENINIKGFSGALNIDLSGCANGVYFMEIKDANHKTEVQKLLINN